MSMNGEKVGALRMGQRESTAVLALAIAAMVGLSACSKVAKLKGIMSFKEANQAYQAQDYKRAAELYEESLQSDPNQPGVYFYLGNSYDNQFKAGRGRPGQRRAAPQGRRELRTGRREAQRSRRYGSAEARAAVPGGCVRLRQAERSGQGRAGRSEDDSDSIPPTRPITSRSRRFTKTPASTTKPKRFWRWRKTPSRAIRRFT